MAPAPGPTRVKPVCPSCRGPLAWFDLHAGCPACARRYRRLPGEGVDFLGEVSDAHTQAQRAIYEGDVDGRIHLLYQDREDYRRRLDQLFGHIARHGMPFATMKDAMNGVMFARTGFSRGMEVLDVGAGSGLLLNCLAALFGVRGTGVDISELAQRRAAEYNPMGLTFHLADALRLPFPDGSFDRVVSFDVLEHLPEQRAALAEAARCVRPGGRLLFYAISAADGHTWHWVQREATGGRVGTDDGGGHVRELFLDPATTAAWLREAGFREVEVVPFHAFYTLLIDERLQGVTRMVFRRPLLFKALFRLARAADGPWEAAGLGNGFYLFGVKGGG